ncbi:MAG TPA: hypothetical protein VK095_00240 [Beutenbergiaceae bacterium]|nr:hypothetical protein [Beutenbergiaceae bacterium]
MPPDLDDVQRTAKRQSFVLTRRQLLAKGANPDWISRRVASGRWQRSYPGVYVVHTGSMSWRTQMVAALHYAGENAVLSHSSAAQFWFPETFPPVRQLVEVSVPRERRVRPQPGLRIHHRRRMPSATSGFSVTARAETVLDLIDRVEAPDDVVGLITLACRRMSHDFLLAAMGDRQRLRHRSLVRDVLTAAADGIESPLELRYHRDVERAHRLPRSERQLREQIDGGWIRADCRYRRYRLRVELDGQLAHPDGRTVEDTWRDNAVLLTATEVTLRYRWHHVAVTPCRTAAQVAEALRLAGWIGVPRQCSADCAVRWAAGPPA